MDSIKPYVQLMLPGHCYDTFLEDLNFFDVDCWKVFISKGLGYGIILGSVLVKLPQILKILAARSGVGLSMLSIYLELLAVTSSCAYGYNAKFPFSSYGDSLFMLVQTSIIAILVLMFSGRTVTCMLYLAIQSAIIWFLFLSGLAPSDLIWALQAANMPVVASSKMIQAFENYKNGHTGQLSAITVVLLFLGSLARIFTSHQETGDLTMILVFVVGTLCNGILLFQVIIYWNVASQDKKKK